MISRVAIERSAPSRAATRCTLIAALALACADPAWAQSEDDENEARSIERTRQTLEDDIEQPLTLAPEGPPLVPLIPGLDPPALGPESYALPPGTLIREGAFLRNRRGRLVGVSGSWVIVFDKDARSERDPPMILQPCIRSREMARIAVSAEVTPTFIVSGTVFAYRERNYLLPQQFAVVDYSRAGAAQSDTGPEPSTDLTSDEADPDVADLLREMRAGTSVRESAPGAGAMIKPAPEMLDPDARVLQEGVTIMNRVGRVVRGGAGYWTFVPDRGVNQEPLDPPMRLLPCMNLMGIERVMHELGAGARLSLSGQVFIHGGIPYLLPTVYRVEIDREGNVVSAQ